MIAQNFEYTVATSLGEAVNLLQKHGGRAKILAGGHSLIPMMKLRLAAPETLIDIGRIPELSYVRRDGEAIHIGALATHHVIETSDVVSRHCLALADAAGLIGDIQVRNKGTIGGSIAHADPAADYPASILAFDATIVTLGPKGERLIPASKFFVDMLTTALEPNEIVREIQIPLRSGKIGSAYLKMAQKASGFAICGAAAVVELNESGALSNVAIGITGVGNHAFRATETEKALKGQKPARDILKTACEKAPAGVVALEDIHASADYRLDLTRIFARRAVEAAIERAG
ncbi:MAG TPA: xanthine dehydrogenase family protein subunit M [Terriglobia bacterium]|nr:xanthine dehydrogenase family protein subunit M [Terriglobia bacterium]